MFLSFVGTYKPQARLTSQGNLRPLKVESIPYYLPRDAIIPVE